MWIIDVLLPFILLLGILIFFHELGHFLVAKWMGVRVLTFAIGFGPAIPGLTRRRGETDYRVNWFPLGGYVQFHGDDPSEELTPEERRGAFTLAPLWRRFLIVLAGPVFNLVLPLLVLFPMFLFAAQALPARLGHVVDGGAAAEAGLREGDEITRIDGRRIRDWWEMERTIARSGGETLEVTVRRGGELVGPLAVTPEEVVVRRVEEINWEDRRGRIMVGLQTKAPEVLVRPESIAAQAGLLSGDRVVAVAGEPLGRRGYRELVRLLKLHDGETVELLVHRGPPAQTTAEHPGHLMRAVFSPITVRLPVHVQDDRTISGLDSVEMMVARVRPGSPAATDLGLVPGDRPTHLNGKTLSSWAELERRLLDTPEKPQQLTFMRGEPVFWLATAENGGRALLATLLGPAFAPVKLEAQRSVQASRAGGVERTFKLVSLRSPDGPPRMLFGARNDVTMLAPDPIRPARPLSYAWLRSIDETVEAYKIILMTVAGLLRGQVPMKELGGPLLIADLAGQSMQHGWREFLTLLVWLSINLGILNLLPIPVLDGGHLLLFTAEAIKRKPLSLRARQVASYIGLALILFIMLTAMKNDIERYWHSVFGLLQGGVPF